MMKCHFDQPKKRSVVIELVSASAPTQSFQPDDLINVEFSVSFKVKRESFERYKEKIVNNEFTIDHFETMIDCRR